MSCLPSVGIGVTRRESPNSARQTDAGIAILFSGPDSEPSARPGIKTRRSDQGTAFGEALFRFRSEQDVMFLSLGIHGIRIDTAVMPRRINRSEISTARKLSRRCVIFLRQADAQGSVYGLNRGQSWIYFLRKLMDGLDLRTAICFASVFPPASKDH